MFKKTYWWIFRFFRKEVQARKVRNGDYIFLERRLYILFGLIQLPFFARRWKPLANKRLKIQQELNKCSDKMKKLVNDYKAAVELDQREKEEMGRRLEGDWFDYFLDKGETLKCESLIDEASQSWRKVINPKLAKIRDRHANQNGSFDLSDIRDETRSDVGIEPVDDMSEDLPCSNRTVYHAEDFSPHALVLQDLENADTAMAFKKPQEQKAGKQNRKRLPGETPEEHQKRLNSMDGKE